MTNSSVSTLEELNAAIQNHNPFSNAAVAKVQTVWGKGFPDLPTLNAHASGKVLEIIKQISTSQSSENKVQTLTITADIGSGKTHIIGRLRRRVVDDSSALFVYVNAGKYGDLNLVRYQFQKTLVEEFARIGSEGVTQWQEIAAAIANASNPKGQHTSAATIVRNFDKAYAKYLVNNHNLIKWLTTNILKNKPDADPFLIRAVLWTLSEMHAPYAVEWLAGNELDEETAKGMGLPTNANKTTQDREAESLGKIKQILRLVSDYKPVLICFDELETEGKVSDDGFTKVQVIARLIKDLYDNLEQSSIGKGVAIVTVMFQSTWTSQIKNAWGPVGAGSVMDRMSTATQAKPISLNPLNSQSTVDLVALWLQKELYEPCNLKPHDKVYPFKESELIHLGKSKPTVREVLDWCDRNYKPAKPTLSPWEKFELAIKKVNESDMGNYLDDNALIAEALLLGFHNLIGKPLNGVTSTGEKLKQVIIEMVDTDVRPVASKPKGLYNADWINFKVIGTENNKNFTIGVAVIQQPSAASVGGGLKRLTEYKRFGLTRGCLVRGKDKKISKNTQAYKLLEKLTENMGGEQVPLYEEQIKPLINIYALYQDCERYGLTQNQVLEFSKPRIFENPLLLEILSDPSGQIDSDTIEDDSIIGTLFDDSSTDDTVNNEELSDLFG